MPSSPVIHGADADTGVDAGSITTEHYKQCLTKFLDGVGFECPSCRPDSAMEQEIAQNCHTLAEAQGLETKHMVKIAKLAVAGSFWLYPHHPRELQRLIAFYSAYFFVVDDMGQNFVEDVRRFRQNILYHKQQTPFLQAFAENLQEYDDHYGYFAADMIFKGLIDFMSAAVSEFDSKGHFDIRPTAPHFPDYFRLKTGIPEPYILFILSQSAFPEKHHLCDFIQVVPDLLQMSNGTNDLLSFYKESILATEKINYIHNYATSHGQSVKEAFDALSDRLVQHSKNIRSTLAHNPKLLEYAEAFIFGNIAFHFHLPRYHLLDLDIPGIKINAD